MTQAHTPTSNPIRPDPNDPFSNNGYAVAEKLLDSIKSAGKNEHAIQLDVMFDHTVVAALDMIDRDLVTKVIAQPSGRSFFQVESQSRSESLPYNCFPHYCTCIGFNFAVIVREESLMCKHQLAVRLADCLSKFKIKEIPDIEYANILCKEEPVNTKFFPKQKQ